MIVVQCKVTIEFVRKKFPDALRLMLCTAPEISAINFDNYLHKGFPVPSEVEGGYTYLTMTNMDEEGYPSDSTYIREVGDNDAWNIWTDGLFTWDKDGVTEMVEHSDGSDEELWNKTPISGGYGKNLCTFIVEFPAWMRNAPEVNVQNAPSVEQL